MFAFTFSHTIVLFKKALALTILIFNYINHAIMYSLYKYLLCIRPLFTPKEWSFLKVGSREVDQHLTNKECRQNARNVSLLC